MAVKKEGKSKIEERRTRRELLRELKKKRNDIDVELTNISYVHCRYVDADTKYKYFDLHMGEKEIITLVELQEVINKCRFMFSEHYLIVSDVIIADEEDDKKYTIDDILNYLGLMDIYVDMEDHTIDYIEKLIYEDSLKSFKSSINGMDRALLLSIAGRMLSIFKQDPDDIDRGKVEAISDKLNLGDLFRENWM